MNNTDKKVSSSTRNFVIGLVLLLLTNVLMGITLMTMSKKTLREQIDQRMLDIANTAAYQLDGDTLKTLTADDEATEGYQQALDTLRSFQENIELDYIYGIKAEEDGSFTFTIDPTVEDPGEFGSPIKTTDALKEAAKGTPSVDKKAYTDAWGKFYSAYSPVFDSEGNVAGIVGVDFDAEWYEGKLGSHRAAAVILTMVALSVGIAISLIIMSQNRKRFLTMIKNLESLDREAQKLDDMITHNSIKKLDMLPDSESALLKTLASGEKVKSSSGDEYDKLNNSIDSVYKKLNKYVKYMDSELYTDGATGVGNKAAYRNKVKELENSITAGEAKFSVAFLEVHGIKEVYVNQGYESGDMLNFDSAQIFKSVFGKKNIYHIISDEFFVIMDDKTQLDMEEYFAKLDEEIKSYNAEHKKGNKIIVSKGSATFDPKKYSTYRQVVIDARKNCDKS